MCERSASEARRTKEETRDEGRDEGQATRTQLLSVVPQPSKFGGKLVRRK